MKNDLKSSWKNSLKTRKTLTENSYKTLWKNDLRNSEWVPRSLPFGNWIYTQKRLYIKNNNNKKGVMVPVNAIKIFFKPICFNHLPTTIKAYPI